MVCMLTETGQSSTTKRNEKKKLLYKKSQLTKGVRWARGEMYDSVCVKQMNR